MIDFCIPQQRTCYTLNPTKYDTDVRAWFKATRALDMPAGYADYTYDNYGWDSGDLCYMDARTLADSWTAYVTSSAWSTEMAQRPATNPRPRDWFWNNGEMVTLAFNE